MRGIILAGGSDTRLHPVTQDALKRLIPVYDKPMVYYPLTTLISLRIRDILAITTPHDAPTFHQLLGDGSQFGINLSCAVQEVSNGPAQVFVLDADLIGQDSAALVLSDNIFYRSGTGNRLRRFRRINGGAVFAYHVHNLQAYGVVEFDLDFKAVSIEEKPAQLKSDYAILGLYFYNNDVVGVVRDLKPSARGEYGITNVNRQCLEAGELHVEILPRSTAWPDAGTFDSLTDAMALVRTVERRQDLKVSCPKEAA